MVMHSGALTLTLVLVVMQMQVSNVWCYQYQVGDLNCWGIPPSTNPDVYSKWSNNHAFRLGDSLLFLYPPSEESMIQVTPQSYKTCNLKDPILTMNDGNSLFNITQAGEFYFTSGEKGHCEKGQKLHISISGEGGIAYPPQGSSGADMAAGPASSYAAVFGAIPTASPSPPLLLSFSSFFFVPFSVALLALTLL